MMLLKLEHVSRIPLVKNKTTSKRQLRLKILPIVFLTIQHINFLKVVFFFLFFVFSITFPFDKIFASPPSFTSHQSNPEQPAREFAFTFSTSANMIVTNTLGSDLVLTNLAFCLHADLHDFSVLGIELFHASIGDSLVLSASYPFRYVILICMPYTKVEEFGRQESHYNNLRSKPISQAPPTSLLNSPLD